MKTVYKYTIPANNFGQNLARDFPEHAKFLSVGEQADELVMWVQVDTDEKPEQRTITVVGTGHPIPLRPLCQPEFIGTVQMQSGIVLHVFEQVPNSMAFRRG